MKKFYYVSFLTVMALQASAAVPFEAGHTVRNTQRPVQVAQRAPALQVLIDEDFSLFTDGSESDPAAEISYDGYYGIPSSYTKQPGWKGQGIHPAGGAVAVYQYVDRYGEDAHGYITTPAFNLGGTATFTFRARSLGESAKLWVAVCDDDNGPGYDELDVELTSQWKEYTLVATEAGTDVDSYFQCLVEEGTMLIDDIRLEFKQDRVGAPYALPAINNSPTEFVASWEPVTGADRYLLNVICLEKPVNPGTGSVFENFDGIKTNGTSINVADPGYPEGWTIDLSSHGSQDLASAADGIASAPVTLFFDAVGDMIQSPVTPYPIDGLSFWVKPSSYSESDYYSMSMIRVEIHHSTTDYWESIAQLYYGYMNAFGGVYSFPAEALGNDADCVRISMIQRGEIDFMLDNVDIHYTERGTTSDYIKDLAVTDTKYTVSGINPHNEYTYYVSAALEDIVSKPSYVIWVDGITGLAPEALDATDVTTTTFTANWQPLGHATDYTVEAFRILEPATDMSDVVVLEESFDGVTSGTLDNPGIDWVNPIDYAAKGFTETSWGATDPAWIEGMVGTRGTNFWMGYAGLVFTPTLDLSCYDGNGIKVEATVYTTVDDFDLGDGTIEKEGMFAMIMNSYTENAPIASGYFETPVKGSNTGTAVIANVPEGADLSNVIIAFMNKSGTAFYVDHARISMNVPAGKTLSAPYRAVSTDDTFYKFENLDPAFDHGYTVKASTTRSYETYASESSAPVIVRTSSNGVTDVAVDGSQAAVAALAGTIVISAQQWSVFTTTGVAIATGCGDYSVAVTPGIYIVAADGKTFKIAVK